MRQTIRTQAYVSLAMKKKCLLSILAGMLILGGACTASLSRHYERTRYQRTLTRIAFGSCNRVELPQPLWNPIMAHKPDLWIWLGDNIYGDTTNMDVLKYKYDLQKQKPDYQRLWASVPVIGIWDDHDYGKNDGDATFPYKKESQQRMLEFLNEPASSPRWKQEGAYVSYVFGTGHTQVKIILLDGRYFREPLQRIQGVYQPNETGNLLGEAQWQWLQKELTDSPAALHLIACGVQFIPEEHRFEKWANFPKARRRFFDLLVQTKPKGVILLSGDRHVGEMSRYQPEGMPYPIYEITSSGLTHAYTGTDPEPNRFRVGNLVRQLNFGIMEVDWERKQVKLEIRGKEDSLLDTIQIPF